MEEIKSTVLEKKKFGFSATALKNVAVLTMLLDHFAVAFLILGILVPISQDFLLSITQKETFDKIFTLQWVLREIGRVSFPLFAFLCALGYQHTKNVQNYVLRLLAFALISEIPFDLAFFPEDVGFFSGHQNVYWTFAFSILGLWGYEWLKQQVPEKWNILAYFPLAIAVGASALMNTDYAILGVVMIFGFYFFRNNKKAQMIFYILLYGWRVSPLLALPLLYFYNGEQGASRSKTLRYLFYIFYPLHLILLYFLRIGYLALPLG